MDAEKWSTLPDDLLVDILRRLHVSAVIRCAAACRPWRRAIINNGRFLRPRPDRFLPDLLLGFWEGDLCLRQYHYVPASSRTVPLLPPAAGVCVNGRLYSHLLSSRDGFLLLGEDNAATGDSLCLYTAHTGICRVLPAAEFDNCSMMIRCLYVLATGYDVAVDDSKSDDETAVWILAVDWQRRHAKGGTTYQIFSSTSGEWGAVKCSARFPKDVVVQVLTGERGPSGSVVVCHGAVSWFVYLARKRRPRKCIFSMDLRTERTWTTELPPGVDTVEELETPPLVLAVSEDGRLSLVKTMLPSSSSPQMEVWVLEGDGQQWTLRRTIDDVQKLLRPDCTGMWDVMWLSGFCPRSGFLFGTGVDEGVQHHFIVWRRRELASADSKRGVPLCLLVPQRDGFVHVHIKDEVFLA